MKQGILSKGVVMMKDLPAPGLTDRMVLIKTEYSCISAGTEVSSVKSSGQPLLSRALDQPKKVKKVLENVLKDGLSKTLEQISEELNKEQVLGYSLAGSVVQVGSGELGFSVGDRVAAAGGGFAIHAEYVAVPSNLVMRMPAEVPSKFASTVALGGIAMQAVRRCNLQLGEYVAVYGTGLLGLLAIQMLARSGNRIVAIDIDEKKLEMAKQMGAELTINAMHEDPVNRCMIFTGGKGVDATLFAAATDKNEPLSTAFKICRTKGRVILLGVSGMQLERKDIYQKELDFLVSTSYGPGRYDSEYEIEGKDYPYGYVRWTENRNMTAYLEMIGRGEIDFTAFRTVVYDIDKIAESFNSLKEKTADITLLKYPAEKAASLEDLRGLSTRYRSTLPRQNESESIRTALVGAGQYANNFHLPNIKKLSSEYTLEAVISRTSLSAKAAAEKYSAAYYGTDVNKVMEDQNVDLIVICTRHDSHGELVIRALEHGKHVLVEKPLATDLKSLGKIQDFFKDRQDCPRLTVGFNRRFSTHAMKIKAVCDKRINPLFINYRVNAGHLPKNHWVHSNGGRIVGEGCHFIDLLIFLVNHPVVDISYQKVRPTTEHISSSDNVSIILKFEDGSMGNIQYFALGSRKAPKEILEVHTDGQSIVLEDFRELKTYDSPIKSAISKKIEKGQFQQLNAFYKSLIDPEVGEIIPLWQLFHGTEISIRIANEIGFKADN